MSDGHVRTVKDLNKHIQNRFGTFNKAFIDTTPEIPSYVYKQLMGNVFNFIIIWNFCFFAIASERTSFRSTATCCADQS